MRKAAVTLLTLLVASCTGGGAVTTTGADASPSTSRATVSSTLPPVVECPGVGDFHEGGGIADIPGEASDSRSLGQVTWETSDQCETFNFDFETTEGAPATTVPAIRVDHLESFQVVRINLDIEGTVITDQLVETNLVDRLYVVRALSGGLFVDLHLAAPAAVRASVSSSPARLSLELRPGFVPLSGRSAIHDEIVLTSPAAGSTVDSSVQLLGYARHIDGDLLSIATQGGEVVAEETAAVAGDQDTWGEYRFGLDLPSGPVSVFIGEESPEDGSLEGLTFDLTVS